MQHEWSSQAATLADFNARGRDAAFDAAERIGACAPSSVVIAARGTSDHAALYAKYLIETRTGLPVGLASPSTASLYRTELAYGRTLWLGISQSGASPDLLAHADAAHEGGALCLSITNSSGSPLANLTDHHIDICAGPEKAVAATKTYTGELLAIWTLVQAWTGGSLSAADTLVDQAALVLDRTSWNPREVDELADAAALVTVGRGFSCPTAFEAALKIMETSYLPTLGFSAADLLHGPAAILNPDIPVIAVIGNDATTPSMHTVVDTITAHGSPVTVIGATAPACAHAHVAVPAAADPALDPILQVLPLQALAHDISVGRGLDPDAPRSLNKVTLTL